MKTNAPIAMKTLLALLGALAAVLFAAAPAGADDGVRYYLSLGDSLAAGTNATEVGRLFTDEGYADKLAALERARIPKLELVKLGCPGETTGSMSDPLPYAGRGGHVLCGFPHGSQLAEAVSFLHAHKDKVAFATIDIGANDLFEGVPLQEVQANLASILAQLRLAAGPETPIVGMNYYDPALPSVWVGGGAAALSAEVSAVVGLNDAFEGVYQSAGDPVADVEAAFGVADTTLVDGVPLDVLRECRWTWICEAGDIHPNAAGYGVIAQAFAGVLH